MNSRALGLVIVLVLAAQSDNASASDAGADAALAQYTKRELAIYDALVADSSPRTQVLSGRLWFDKADLMLRPKVKTVVARATNLAPDDAFVQWVSADGGHYFSSQCGPVEYPDAAVAALVRLEPDNAAAFAYAAALAQAKGDADAVDENLARMANAARADDHRGEEIAIWRAIYLAHPDDERTSEPELSSRTPEDNALSDALIRTAASLSARAALKAACAPDAASSNPWQRLGHCVDAGLLLARKGTSFALRDEGVAILSAAGATSEDLADLNRGIEWLNANSPNFMTNVDAIEDSSADRETDWSGAPNDIEATMRRLARLGLPSTPPTGWLSPSDAKAAEQSNRQEVWQGYIRNLVDAMRASNDIHEQAVGLSSGMVATWMAKNDASNASDRTRADRAALIALAASHRDDVLVNWIAAAYASAGSEPDTATLANLQRIDGDNAAVWALSFGLPDVDADAALSRMGSSHVYDEHYVELLGIWNGAIERSKVPDEVTDMLGDATQSQMSLTSADARAVTGSMFATTGSLGTIRYQALDAACSTPESERRTSCIAAARHMFDGRTLLTARIGAAVLKRLDALNDADRARMHQIDWWIQNSMSMDGNGAEGRYVDEILASKNEIEAIRVMMTQAGKLDPPAGWQSPFEKTESNKNGE